MVEVQIVDAIDGHLSFYHQRFTVRHNLHQDIARTRNLTERVDELVENTAVVDDDFYEELTNILLLSDVGVRASTEIIDDPKLADATFQQLSDSRIKTILSVNAQGRVREYRLQLNYRFRVVNAKGQILVPPNEVSLSRDITFDDSNVLAKDLEESLLWRDMNNDLVNQIMRRLSIIKPKNPDLEEDE